MVERSLAATVKHQWLREKGFRADRHFHRRRGWVSQP